MAGDPSLVYAEGARLTRWSESTNVPVGAALGGMVPENILSCQLLSKHSGRLEGCVPPDFDSCDLGQCPHLKVSFLC
jgi:hypothetical protein